MTLIRTNYEFNFLTGGQVRIFQEDGVKQVPHILH